MPILAPPTTLPGPTPARPLVPLTAAFALGIALESVLLLRPSGWTAGVLLALVVAGAAWRVRAHRLFWSVLLLGFTCLGAQAMATALLGLPAHHVSRLPEPALASPIPLEGWVAEPPDPRPAETRDSSDPRRTRFVLEVRRLRLGERWVVATGRARLTLWGESPSLRYGDEVRGTFRLRHPRKFDNPGAFDYPAYLAGQGIFLEGWTGEPVEVVEAFHGSRILGAALHLRRILLERLDAAMAPPEAGLLKATVLGDRSGLTPAMNQAFLDSGTYHILAISGLNVSLLAGTLFGLFRLLRVSARLAAGASALLVTLYAVLAGAGPSVTRAAVMADVYLLAVVLDRRADLLNSLALSALALLWWNPRFLHDVGFQLTYLATLGIILVLPRCEAALAALPRPPRFLLESVAITLAATVVTLPILASAFNRVAPVGVLANIPIVPLSGLITALGAAAGAIFLVVPSGLSWLNQLNGWLVDLLFGLARWFAAWPWSSLRVFTPTPGMLLAYYAGLAALLLGTAPRAEGGASGSRRRWARGLAAACGLLLVIQVGVRLLPPGGAAGVRLTMLDVGQGEAILLDLPGRRRMLVDAGGPWGEGFDVGSRVVAPYLWHEWIRRLDVLVLTHPQADHISGAPAILRNFAVGEVWTGAMSPSSATALWIQEYLRHRKIPHRIVSGDSPPVRWGEAAVEILQPGRGAGEGRPGGAVPWLSANDAALVLKVRIGEQAALLTSDIERDGEAALLQGGKDIRAQVLKVPHHGSRTSSAAAFLAGVRPEVALVSVGYRNRYHHPHPEVLDRYQALGIRVLRTDQNGAISVEMTPEGVRAWGRR